MYTFAAKQCQMNRPGTFRSICSKFATFTKVNLLKTQRLLLIFLSFYGNANFYVW